MKFIYLDACCVGRPFDDQTQPRVQRETEAVLSIMERCRSGEWRWVASAVLTLENDAIPDLARRRRHQELTRAAHVVAPVGPRERRQELVRLGFGVLDAAHLASAEEAGVDVFLTTDDGLLRRAKRLSDRIGVPVDNPLDWLKSHSAGAEPAP